MTTKSFTEMFPKVHTNNTAQEQMYRVLDELVEVEDAMVNENNRLHAGEELVDVMITAANTLYKLGFEETHINTIIKQVNYKNEVRGYYTCKK